MFNSESQYSHAVIKTGTHSKNVADYLSRLLITTCQNSLTSALDRNGWLTPRPENIGPRERQPVPTV